MHRSLRKPWMRAVSWLIILCLVAGTLPASAQIPLPGGPPVPAAPPGPDMDAAAEAAAEPAGAPPGGEKLISLNFRDAPLDQVLQFYAEMTGRTLIKSPGINATITLRGQTRLTQKEAMQAIESVLAMNNVTLVPMGKKFFKVVQPTAARQEAMEISKELPETPFDETDRLVSQIITLKYIELAEAQTIIQGFLHGYGKIQALERTNSLLITDTSGNLQRIIEILDYIDQPTETRVETRIYELKYAKASEIAGRLNELIQESQAKEEKPRVAAAPPAAPSPPGVIRARQPPAPAAVTPEAAVEAALAERGIVQGKVKIVADERTNILIVISRPPNFTFFDKIVAILDRPVEPDVIVRVVPLEYAKAEEISGILNEFIGAAKSETKAAAAQPAGTEGAAEGEASQAKAIDQVVRDLATQRAADRIRQAVTDEKAKIGQLSANTKILADKRTNSLLLMGTKGDLAALMEIIYELDTMLAQVLIEAVILEVNLSKNLDYGVDWLQRSMVGYADSAGGGPGDALVRDPIFAFGGGQRLSEGTTFLDGRDISRSDPTLSAGALTYFTTIFDLNIDAVIRLAAGSSDARILQTPVILTTDNTEAKIVVGEERPVVTSTSTSSAGQQTSSYQYRNIGINLTCTPRINPQRFVTMEIVQTADNVGGFEVIDGNRVPVITKREMQAQIAVPSRSTIVLGGLVSTDRRKSRAKVPILGDIPILGTLFRSDSRDNNRTELLVLLTPYVLTSPEEARAETERLHRATRAAHAKWYRGWSDSPLASPTPEELKQQKDSPADQQGQDGAKPAAKTRRSALIETGPKVSVVVPSDLPADAAPQRSLPVESSVLFVGQDGEIRGESEPLDSEEPEPEAEAPRPRGRIEEGPSEPVIVDPKALPPVEEVLEQSAPGDSTESPDAPVPLN